MSVNESNGGEVLKGSSSSGGNSKLGKLGLSVAAAVGIVGGVGDVKAQQSENVSNGVPDVSNKILLASDDMVRFVVGGRHSSSHFPDYPEQYKNLVNPLFQFAESKGITENTLVKAFRELCDAYQADVYRWEDIRKERIKTISSERDVYMNEKTPAMKKLLDQAFIFLGNYKKETSDEELLSLIEDSTSVIGVTITSGDFSSPIVLTPYSGKEISSKAAKKYNALVNAFNGRWNSFHRGIPTEGRMDENIMAEFQIPQQLEGLQKRKDELHASALRGSNALVVMFFDDLDLSNLVPRVNGVALVDFGTEKDHPEASGSDNGSVVASSSSRVETETDSKNIIDNYRFTGNISRDWDTPKPTGKYYSDRAGEITLELGENSTYYLRQKIKVEAGKRFLLKASVRNLSGVPKKFVNVLLWDSRDSKIDKVFTSFDENQQGVEIVIPENCKTLVLDVGIDGLSGESAIFSDLSISEL